MKKISVIIVLLLILCGCTGKLDEDTITYHSYVEELSELKKTTTSKGIVDVSIELNQYSDDEITYSVVIDNPKEKMKNVEAIVYHDQETTDVYPSVGIYDKKLNLLPNLKKNEGKNVKGIVLVGYIKTRKNIKKFHPTLKVMIIYYNSENERQKIYYSKTL